MFTFNVYSEATMKWVGAIRAKTWEDATQQAIARFGNGNTFLKMCM